MPVGRKRRIWQAGLQILDGLGFTKAPLLGIALDGRYRATPRQPFCVRGKGKWKLVTAALTQPLRFAGSVRANPEQATILDKRDAAHRETKGDDWPFQAQRSGESWCRASNHRSRYRFCRKKNSSEERTTPTLWPKSRLSTKPGWPPRLREVAKRTSSSRLAS